MAAITSRVVLRRNFPAVGDCPIEPARYDAGAKASKDFVRTELVAFRKGPMRMNKSTAVGQKMGSTPVSRPTR